MIPYGIKLKNIWLPFKHEIVQATLGIEIVAGVIEVKAILGVVIVSCVKANVKELE